MIACVKRRVAGLRTAPQAHHGRVREVKFPLRFGSDSRRVGAELEDGIVISALTGLIAGAVHVWSGPDHLAALAPLAVRRPRRAWLPGMRWGLGHSAGVGLIGLLSLWLRDRLPVDLLSTWGERLVGVMLFAPR